MYRIRERTTFNVPGMTEEQKKQYIFILQHIAWRHESYFNFPVSEKIKSIEVFSWDTRSQDLIANNALGLAFFDGRIQMVYANFPRFDGQIFAMEHAHHVILEALPWHEYADEMNNLIHYAANVGMPYLVKDPVTYYASKWDYLRRNGVAMELQYYNMGKILDDMTKINEAIRQHTAPAGPHQYWYFADASASQKMKSSGIAHIVDAGDLDGGPSHHH